MSRIFLILPLTFLVFFCSTAASTAVGPDAPLLFSLPWVPQLGIYFSFSLNTLSLFMGLLIATIGSVIMFYATEYMKFVKHQYRFWTFFSIFTLAMLGLVLSENLITLFLFWEATSICSFFLIGHYHEDENSRKSALNSLFVTGFGGLFLLVGFIGLAIIGGSYEISALMQNKEALLSHSLIWLPFTFIMIGVMTKSAQFPLHFWLPQAMAGPAPVSAFLHSATMVKAGVFLLARLFPLLSDLAFWEISLTSIGLTTFLWGGFVAIRNFDIKGILANTTISALGCLIALLGMAKSYPKALEAFLLFFIAHAFYKAALFMCAGIIEKKFKNKDIRKVKMTFANDPLLSLALIVACLSMMGLPPTIGFIAKETFLGFSTENILYLIPLMLGGLLNFIAAAKIIYHLFLSNKEASNLQYPQSTLILSLAPFALGLATLAFSFAGPRTLNQFIANFMHESTGLQSQVQVSLWHGFNLPLLLSAITVITGILGLLFLRKFTIGIEDKPLNPLSPTKVYNSVLNTLLKVAALFTRYYQSGYLRHYFLIIFGSASLLIATSILYFAPGFKVVTSPIHFIDVGIGLIIAFCAVSTLVTESKIWAVTQIGIIGTCIILFFIFNSAPDLALTQVLVEIFTLTIFIFAIHRLPRLKRYSTTKGRLRDFVVSASFGLLMGYLTYFSFSNQMEKTVAEFYAENSFLKAQGKNIVNVILVDFRSFDTLGEISVVLMAAIGVYILMRKREKQHE